MRLIVHRVHCNPEFVTFLRPEKVYISPIREELSGHTGTRSGPESKGFEDG